MVIFDSWTYYPVSVCSFFSVEYVFFLTGDCTVGNIEHGNSRATPEVAEGEQLYWQCDFDYFHYPGNGESVCRDGALVPAPECRPSKLSCCCDFIRNKTLPVNI